MNSHPLAQTAQLPLVFEIHNESNIFTISKTVKTFAQALGFSNFEAGLLSMAVSELVTNVVRYAQNGQVQIKHSSNHKGIEVQVIDQGTGIKNLPQALTDGYSSINSLGLGLGAAKRSVDEMLIESSATGTIISLNKYLPVSKYDLNTGMVSFPCVGEHSNGDAYLVKGYHGDSMLVAVFDGAGCGLKAQQASEVVVAFFKQNYLLPLDTLIKTGHQILLDSKHTRGVEVAILRITPSTIDAVIMGNLTIHTNSTPHSCIPVQNGSMGLSIPKNIHIHHFSRPQQFRFVLHSDGITNIDYNAILTKEQSAQKEAEQIFDAFAIADDDATVVVVHG